MSSRASFSASLPAALSTAATTVRDRLDRGRVAILLLALVAAVASSFEAVGAGIRSLSLPTIQSGVGGLLLVGAALAGWVAYREAVRRFEEHEPY
jgi:hypothetical protein